MLIVLMRSVCVRVCACVSERDHLCICVYDSCMHACIFASSIPHIYHIRTYKHTKCRQPTMCHVGMHTIKCLPVRALFMIKCVRALMFQCGRVYGCILTRMLTIMDACHMRTPRTPNVRQECFGAVVITRTRC